MSGQADRAGIAERARLVTREFQGLQGYRMLPWVAPLLVWWAWEAGVAGEDRWWMWAAAVVAATVGTWWIGRWYDRTYGTLRHGGRSARVARAAAVLGLGLLGVYGLIAVLSMTGNWPLGTDAHVVSWFGVVLGVATVIIGSRIRSLSSSLIWFGVAVIVLSLIPFGLLVDGDGRHPFSATSAGAGVGLLTTLLIVVGVTTHRTLHRCLVGPRASTASPEQAAGHGGADAT
ncbi:hypothetical protein FHR81_000828 [Actinoalloteichus hoggarensis]|uniref:Uncharacterized protein n=1 Tax=Actinoalloteichus hoggarensis TaxID=1470176 RepID=A0A221W124_9PSEU|nr:hypothetical protein [Actinoalloteichus hoggarensis]ASO19495.1 hypothetical protein AHOG_09255 [Actinoalloteichus hoggarensis]MBB5919799.1 hypothetical protein [Actinoalloteichus hoggarensis]